MPHDATLEEIKERSIVYASQTIPEDVFAFRGSHTFEIIDNVGHIRLQWDQANKEHVQRIKEEFERLVKKWKIFLVGKDGKESRQVTEFDPSYEALIISDKLAGG